MNSIINLNYRGNNVPVKLIEGEPWVNLNAVGRPFGKEPKEWLKNNSTNEYLEALSLLNNQGENSPLGENESKTTISVQHGGKNPGTWARYEAHSRGQLMRHSKKKNEIVWLNVQDDGIPILNDNEIF